MKTTPTYRLLLGAALGAVALSPATLWAQTPGTANLGRRDKSFVLKVAEGSTEELTLSQLALTRSTNSDVKDFAQKMIDDHTKLNSDLSDIASHKNVDISDAVAKGQKGDDSLAHEQEPDFDRDYIKAMVKGHDDTLTLFKAEMDKGRDPDLTAFATHNISTIQQHDDHAHSLAQSIH